jgi:hypothetical protein
MAILVHNYRHLAEMSGRIPERELLGPIEETLGGISAS